MSDKKERGYQELATGASIMPKRHYEILLPLRHNDGR
jgi:hypothetical protein